MVAEDRWTEKKEGEEGGWGNPPERVWVSFGLPRLPHHLEAQFLRHLGDHESRRKKEGKALVVC